MVGEIQTNLTVCQVKSKQVKSRDRYRDLSHVTLRSRVSYRNLSHVTLRSRVSYRDLSHVSQVTDKVKSRSLLVGI